MQKWKDAFDEYTRMPKAPPLPTALFINHGFDTYDSQGGAIKVTSDLQHQCEEVKRITEAVGGVHHVNPMSGEGIFEAFESFVMTVLEDQEENHRDEDMVDDLWDESIRVK